MLAENVMQKTWQNLTNGANKGTPNSIKRSMQKQGLEIDAKKQGACKNLLGVSAGEAGASSIVLIVLK